MKKTFLYALLLPVAGFAQQIENLKATSQGNKIIILYDVSQAYAGDKLDVSVYGSHNGFSSPLKRVSGDVGPGVTPGKGKKIEWDSKTELAGFKGELTFEVRAELIAALSMVNASASAKRGKPMAIHWRGGTKHQNVKIELLKGSNVLGVVSTTANNGEYAWSVPAGQKTGSGYQLRLTNGGETVMSPPFSIRHKVPTLLKALPIVVVAVAVGMSGGGSSSSSSSSASTNLAAPPDLGLN